MWDARGRLAQIRQGEAAQVVAAFTYDHAGRRISSAVQDEQGRLATTHYLYEGLQAIAEVREAKVSASLITGLALDDAIARASRVNGTIQIRTYLRDALGSVLALTTEGQAVESGYACSAYDATMARCHQRTLWDNPAP